jgi:hypothetical protein
VAGFERPLTSNKPALSIRNETCDLTRHRRIPARLKCPPLGIEPSVTHFRHRFAEAFDGGHRLEGSPGTKVTKGLRAKMPQPVGGTLVLSFGSIGRAREKQRREHLIEFSDLVLGHLGVQPERGLSRGIVSEFAEHVAADFGLGGRERT